MGRVYNSYRNMKSGIVYQVSSSLVNLICRIIFLRILSIEYIGTIDYINGIINVLTLVEFGMSLAITTKLYKCFGTNDYEYISKLVSLYRKISFFIFSFILIVGVCIQGIVINIDTIIPYSTVQIMYWLLLFETAFSYIETYKNVIFIADQKKYIIDVINTGLLIIIAIFRIIVLFLTKNIIMYLCIGIVFKILGFIVKSIYLHKFYPDIHFNDDSLNKEERKSLFKFVSSTFIYKLSSSLASVTDSTVISRFVGVSILGSISNYNVIIYVVALIGAQITNSYQSSFGNYVATEGKSGLYELVCKALGISFIFVIVIFPALLTCLNDAVYFLYQLPLNFDITSVYLIIFNSGFLILLDSMTCIVNAAGLFKDDVLGVIVSTVINVTLSIILVFKFQLNGVYFATVISTIVLFFMRYRVVFKKYLNTSNTKYLLQFGKYIVITFIVCVCCVKLGSYIYCDILMVTIILKGCICLLLSVLTLLLLSKVDHNISFAIENMKKLVFRKQ